jgi:ABC-2 type transport system ATP-binding protein
MTESPIAELHQLHLSYGKAAPTLRGLDWRLHRGQVVGLLGRNGAGKTSLIEALLGLRAPSAGRANLYGMPAQRPSDAVRAKIGYVPQHSGLFEDLGVQQLLDYFASFYPQWNTAKVDQLLSRWDIPKQQRVGSLSGGQQQRLSIIRALGHEPELLVLDEPVASLDPSARRDFLRELVEQVVERGTTVLFSTHILSDLERVAVEVAFLREGRIALQAPLDELMEQTRRVDAGLQPQASAIGMAPIGRPELGLLRGDWAAAPPALQAQSQPLSLETLFEALA